MWTLLLSRISDPPGSFFDRRQLDAGQVKVGRSAKTCDLVLPDEEGVVSREHCTISAQGLELYVVDTSKNGVALNAPGSRVAPNLPVPVRPNDRLLIGEFVITIATEAMGAGINLVPPPPPPLPMQSGGQGDDVWFNPPADPVWDGDMGGPLGNEMHDFLNSAVSDFLAPPRGSGFDAPHSPSDFGFGDPLGQAFSRPIMADPLPPPAQFGIPEDWATAPSPAGGDAPLPDFGAAPIPDFGPPPTPDFGPPADSGSDPFALGAPQPPAFDDFGDMAPPTPPADLPPPSGDFDPFDLSAPMANHDPGDFGSFDAPSAPPPAATPSAQIAPSAVPPVGAAAWDAFFEGAGLNREDVQLSPDAMRRLGVMYRQVVLGLWNIIQDRAAFKDEFRVERTQLSMGKNNPIKHLPPLDAARFLLGEPLPGFMSAEEAVRTAFEDIKKHQLAMLAGVQQALSAVFDRLSPGEIEKMIEKAMADKKGLKLWRGIDRWSVYLTVFEALRKDATTNANGVMSVAFREGYEKFLKSAE